MYQAVNIPWLPWVSVSISTTSGNGVQAATFVNGVQVGGNTAGNAPLAEIDHNRAVRRNPSHSAKRHVVDLDYAPNPPSQPSSAAPWQPPAPIAAPSAPSRKRKAYALADDSTARAPRRGHSGVRSWDCDQVRYAIRDYLRTEHVKICDFQRTLGVSASAYRAFMKQFGPFDGENTATYRNARDFFSARETLDQTESAGVRSGNTAKRAKTAVTTTALEDVSDVMLPWEELGRIPVFDTCDEVRRKIRVLLAQPGASQASLCRELSKMVASEGRNVRPDSLAKFLAKKGPSGGASSIVFYAAFVYFEKMRVANDQPKSNMRLEMEAVWGVDGMTLPREGRQRKIWCPGDRQPYEDKYGRVHFTAV